MQVSAWLYNLIVKWLTFLYKVGRSISLKGRYPAIKTYNMTPQDQTSAAAPS